MTIKIISTTQLGVVAYNTKCKQDNYNSMVNKQRWRRRNQKRRKAKQRMALRLPRPYILVHNRNRIENAPMTPLFYFNDFKQLPTQRDTHQTIEYAITMKSNPI